jgi:L-histidine N-alpha-methyltransferase
MTVIFESDCNRLKVFSALTGHEGNRVAEEVEAGLTASPRTLPSKYFYDARGSKLFEEICDLPEYYQTRTELALLEEFGSDIMAGFASGDLIELGSGANRKIRALLDALTAAQRSLIRYVPVDISETALIEAAEHLLELYPNLSIMGLVTDFHHPLERLDPSRRKLFLFLGSTIGNLDDDQATEFLSSVAALMDGDDRFLLGLDTLKEPAVLERAYNDAAGVTAAFNKNILSVLNTGLGANFDEEAFDHLAFFNPELSQIEMHLVARREMEIAIEGIGLSFVMDEGESIRTEICRKFDRTRAEAMVRRAGLHVTEWYTDAAEAFALALLEKGSTTI